MIFLFGNYTFMPWQEIGWLEAQGGTIKIKQIASFRAETDTTQITMIICIYVHLLIIFVYFLMFTFDSGIYTRHHPFFSQIASHDFA